MVPPACQMLLVSFKELQVNRKAELHLLAVHQPDDALLIAHLPEPLFAEELAPNALHPDCLSATLARWLARMQDAAALEAFDFREVRIELAWSRTECRFWVLTAEAHLRPPFWLHE